MKYLENTYHRMLNYNENSKKAENRDELKKYFSDKEIIRVLCRLRTSLAKKRHDQQFLFNISTYAPVPGLKESDDDELLCGILPPRKEWCRLKLTERKHKNTLEINALSIERAVSIKFKQEERGKEILEDWFRKLKEFLHKIQDVVLNESLYKLSSPRIQPIKKNSDKNNHNYRLIALYSLSDKIIMGQVSKYFRTIFNQDFLDSSYAFRVKENGKPCPEHHDAVKTILQYRSQFENQDLWVAECDIQRFFDCVGHQEARNAFQRAKERAENRGKSIDEKAVKFFYQYLDSYSFKETAQPKAQAWFEKYNPQGKIEEIDKLLSKFYSNIPSENIGIPQGGALSCLIANLILDEADRRVKEHGDHLFYARFCDDMIMIHPSKEKCQSAFETYQEALKELKLPIHKPKNVTPYRKDSWKKVKSKEPYKWGNKQKNNVVPWIGFVGYQVRYDGYIRIRPSSLFKEFRKQIAETDKVLNVIFEKPNTTNRMTKNNYLIDKVRKTPRQIIYRLTQRLVAMSVGHRKLDQSIDSIKDFCWCRGFKLLKNYPFIKSQLQILDRGRNYQIRRAKRLLEGVPSSPSQKRGRQTKRVIKYVGKPFSYSAQFPSSSATTASPKNEDLL